MKILLVESGDIDKESNCLTKDIAKKYESEGFTHLRVDGQLWTVRVNNVLGHKFIDLCDPVED